MLQKRLAAAFANLVIGRPGAVALVLLVLGVGSTFAAVTRLHLNTNQLDLISQELRQVKDVKRVVDMIGGTGHMMLALRSNDEKLMKAVADDLAAQLVADTEHVRSLTYKVSTEFVRSKAALFMKTEDLVELRRRVTEKLKDAAKRASPFFMEIVPTPPVELKVADLIEKYTRIGKKSIVDDYYISEDRKMIMMLIKPQWATTDIGLTGPFREQMRENFKAYGAKNVHGARLVEDYEGVPDADPKVVQFGFAGSYTNTCDDSVLIEESLGPVSLWALAGIVMVLLSFFRRRVGSVAFVLLALAFGVALAFGFAAVSVGELNMITSILGGILMGTGIDFGIFFVYRLREELRATSDVSKAVRETIVNAGPASFISALGTGVAFLSLVFSDFRGFSQFGLLAGVGVFVIGLTIYAFIPAVLLLVDRRFPGFARRVIGGKEPLRVEKVSPGGQGIPAPKVIIAVTVVAALVFAFFARDVIFDYDSRALMVENQPAVRLQDEVNRRFQISADPVAVYTPTIEATKALFDTLTPLDPARHSTIEQVVSIYTFLPAPEQQARNAAIVADWKQELSAVDPGVLPPDLAPRWGEAMAYLDATPYGLDGIPPLYADLFKHLPQTLPENRGFLTYIYPKVDLWDGKQMLAFAEQVENIEVAGGETYHAAGVTILMSVVAKIVLADAKLFVVLTFALLLVVLIADLWSLKKALIALVPLAVGGGVMLGIMGLFDWHLNFMNIVVFPIVIGFGVSQGVYLIHRFNEGATPRQALVSVGTAVACSSLTALVGWASLMAASHKGLKSMGLVACLGMAATLLVAFTVMPAILQLIDDRRKKSEPPAVEEEPEVKRAG